MTAFEPPKKYKSQNLLYKSRSLLLPIRSNVFSRLMLGLLHQQSQLSRRNYPETASGTVVAYRGRCKTAAPSTSISNLISWLRLHQFLGTNTTEANKSKKLMQMKPTYKITNEEKD